MGRDADTMSVLALMATDLQEKNEQFRELVAEWKKLQERELELLDQLEVRIRELKKDG